MKLVPIVILFSLSTSLAQDLDFAKHVVKILCSDSLHGRGYVDHGDKRAAAFIAQEFDQFGLKKFTGNYYQPYDISVNTFPGKMSLLIDGTNLKPGVDYLVDPGSPSISGKFKTVTLSINDLLNDQWIKKANASTGKFLVVESYDKDSLSTDQIKTVTDIISFLQYNRDNPAKGTVILTRDKLTWSSSQVQYRKPSITIDSKVVRHPIRSITLNIESAFIPKYQTQNVIGYIEGRVKDTLLVFTAHYDHLGMMGKETIFPGANDNASGVAMVLSLAKYYATQSPKYSMVFITFSGEELGLLGSAYFTEHPLFDLKQIKFLINFDISGTGDDGIQIVNGKVYKDKFDRITAINKNLDLLKQIKIRGESCNSDHCMFYRKGVPSFFIYTLGGIQAYHDVYDRSETLPLTEFSDYFTLMTKFIDTF